MQRLNVRRDKKRDPNIVNPVAHRLTIGYGAVVSPTELEESPVEYTTASRPRLIFRSGYNNHIDYLSDLEHMIPEERPRTPERALLAALLGQALVDLTSRDRINRRSAEKWIFTQDPPFPLQTPLPDFDFSFSRVCVELDLNPDELRKVILARISQPDPEPFSPKRRSSASLAERRQTATA